jgi:hypothetical protein
MISEVTKLVSNDNNNSFKLPLSLFLEDTNYDDINQTGGGGGRERLVIDLYSIIKARLIAKYLRWQEYLQVI